MRIILRSEKGGAYIFILVVMLLLFMWVTVLVEVTATGRKMSQQYPYYTHLYDLAVAGNEKALYFMREALLTYHGEIDAQIRLHLTQLDITQHGVYNRYQFHLGFPEDQYIAHLYRMLADHRLMAYFDTVLHKSQGKYWFAYTLQLDGTADTAFGQPVAETYHIKTTLEKQDFGYLVSTTARKALSLSTEEAETAENAVVVTAEIIWEIQPHDETVMPAFTFSGGQAPPPLAAGVYEAAVDPSAWDMVIDESITFSDAIWREENTLYRTDATTLDVSTLYKDGTAIPTILINLSDTPMQLYASDASQNNFIGYIAVRGNVVTEGIHINGLLISGGTVTQRNTTVTPDPNILFTVPLAERSRYEVMDFFRLTRFSAVGAGRETDINALLIQVTPDMRNAAEYALINYFDVVTLSMVKSKKITG